MTTVLDFSAARANGEDTALSEFGGKVLLIVNTASKCGFTRQYEGLESLQKSFGDRGFSVLAFPCNQFGKQEPSKNAKIKQFCHTKFNISFPLFSKIDVKGKNQSPLYEYLEKNLEQRIVLPFMTWNFCKILVDKNGNVKRRFLPTTAFNKIEHHLNIKNDHK